MCDIEMSADEVALPCGTIRVCIRKFGIHVCECGICVCLFEIFRRHVKIQGRPFGLGICPFLGCVGASGGPSGDGCANEEGNRYRCGECGNSWLTPAPEHESFG